jgi:TrmH family RNA methyltransferase
VGAPIGAAHPAFKDLLRIRRGSVPADDGRVVAEGLWAVQLLLRLGTPIEQLFYCPDLIHSDQARACAAAAADRAGDAFQVSAKIMQRVSERDAAEGLLALVRQQRWSERALTPSTGALIVVADGLENPGNLGTLLRTADGAGAELVVVTNRRARLSHPQVFRASHGMSLKVPQVEFARAQDAVAWLQRHGCTVHLAAPGGDLHYRHLDCGGRTALVFGSERFGLSPVWGQQEFRRVAIPMLGAADSLNVAAAAAILLYEVRARKQGWDRQTDP